LTFKKASTGLVIQESRKSVVIRIEGPRKQNRRSGEDDKTWDKRTSQVESSQGRVLLAAGGVPSGSVSQVGPRLIQFWASSQSMRSMSIFVTINW
jgi:hypothetical protein